MERTINAVLSTLPFGPEIDRKVEEAFAPAKVCHVDGRDDSGIAAVIQKVDVVLLPSDLDHRILAGRNLKWIHCCHAGLTKSARPEVFERGILLTGGGGRTPHFTPKAENFAEDAIKVLLENLERYRRGEPLKNQMKPRDILTKRKLY